MTSLNPVMKVGRQITESLRYHLDMDKGEANELAVSLLRSVGIPEPVKRLKEYPHQLSGGMRQRVVIAIALACGPKLLFADEPTTALDVTVQAQILNLLDAQQRERYMAMILVTHDLGVVAGRAHDIAVMYAGKVVETAPTHDAVRHRCGCPTPRHCSNRSPSSSTRATPGSQAIAGRPPDLINPPPGCDFAPRCRYAQPQCLEEEPPLHRRRDARPPLRAAASRSGTDAGDEALSRNIADGRRHADGVDVDDQHTGGPLMAGTGTAHLRDRDDVVLRVEDLVVEFPVGRGRDRACRVAASASTSSRGRDARARGRVGLRQVDDRQGASCSCRADTSGTVTFERHRPHRAAAARRCASCARASR
ncbi:MAG: ABC transporter ATP-binding protein [Acidimicrobiales bacterium]|nr:ABC transporter ATP-binding protein [Acidimicrobiales bacterium]